MKKFFIAIFLLLIKVSVFSQRTTEIKIAINTLKPSDGAFIFFPLLNDTITITGRASVLLDTSVWGRKLFYCVWNDKKSRFYNLNEELITGNFIDFAIGNKKYYDSIYKIRSCPLCHRSD